MATRSVASASPMRPKQLRAARQAWLELTAIYGHRAFPLCLDWGFRPYGPALPQTPGLFRVGAPMREDRAQV